MQKVMKHLSWQLCLTHDSRKNYLVEHMRRLMLKSYLMKKLLRSLALTSPEYHLQNVKNRPTEVFCRYTRRSRSWSRHTQCCCGQISCRTSNTLPQREFVQLVGRKQDPFSTSCQVVSKISVCTSNFCPFREALFWCWWNLRSKEEPSCPRESWDTIIHLKQPETYRWWICLLSSFFCCCCI